MNAAAAVFQHHALVVLLFHQGKSRPVRAQARVACDEIALGQSHEIRNDGGFALRDSHIAGPFAAGVAALADIMHARLQHGLIVSGAAVGKRSRHSSMR